MNNSELMGTLLSKISAANAVFCQAVDNSPMITAKDEAALWGIASKFYDEAACLLLEMRHRCDKNQFKAMLEVD